MDEVALLAAQAPACHAKVCREPGSIIDVEAMLLESLRPAPAARVTAV